MMNSFPWRRALSALPVLLLVTASCARTEQINPEAEEVVIVFAAASLRDAFTALGEQFERLHPGAEVTFNFAGTQELRTQLEHGALADVFASADQRHMDELTRASRATDPVVFTKNEPVMVVASEAASSVQSFADLPRAERIVIGAPDVPIGRYTLQILDRAELTLGADFRERVEANVASRELNVRQVLTKVSLGEAQAGVVYRTDALSAKERVTVVPIPAEMNVIAAYPIALVKGAQHPRLARAWLAFVSSPEGQSALKSAGFTPAEGGTSR